MFLQGSWVLLGKYEILSAAFNYFFRVTLASMGVNPTCITGGGGSCVSGTHTGGIAFSLRRHY